MNGLTARGIALLAVLTICSSALALDWICLAPNPSYSRDLAMGTGTAALAYPPQSQSVNPAGLRLFNPKRGWRPTIVLNPGGGYQFVRYLDNDAQSRSGSQRVGDGLRMISTAIALQARVVTVALLLSQPVMLVGDTARFEDYENKSPLDAHQNSLHVSLALHPRVSVGGRVDRYYAGDVPEGEGYSYGVILRPRNVSVGVCYQRFPSSGARLWHPLDRRSDQTTTAAVALTQHDWTFTAQVNNLTQSDRPVYLEPHGGIEWRPVRALALRSGATLFSRSRGWAWTSGVGLLDANWLRPRDRRLLIPDDVLQLAVAVVYDRYTPRLGIASLTCAWRF